MAEESNTNIPETNDQESPLQQFKIQRIYLKDLSFESPMGITAFKQQWQPKLTQELNTKTNKLDDENYEVVLTITLTVRINEQTVFLIEVQQGGIFLIKGIEKQAIPQVLNTHCPQILFPYIRETIDTVVTKGSFPALMMPPVNFDTLYSQAMAQAQQNAANEATESTMN